MAAPKRTSIARTATPASRGARPTTALATPELTPVAFVESTQAAPDFDPDMASDGFTETPSALTPTAEWGQRGEFFEGTYLGLQESVGPNESRLYNMQTLDKQMVSVWGSTVLDNRMDLAIAQGLRPGDTIRIIYVGDTEAKKGQNPARLFKVGFKKA